jgi:two-component system chemotaxis sensor kinase CheA
MNIVKRLQGNKYKELIFSVALFLFLDTGILGMNFYITTQLDKDAHAISMMTRQQTFAEAVMNNLHAVYIDAKTPDAPYMKTIDLMAAPFHKFDETLDSMRYGGMLIGAGQGGDNLFSQDDYQEMNKDSLDKVDAIWKEYRLLLLPIASAYFNDYSRSDVVARTEKALAFAKTKHPEMSILLGEMANTIESTTRKKVQDIRKVQAVGILLAIANFALILFHFIRKMTHSDSAADKAQHEVREILGSVNEGLFLLDKKLDIGEQHSASLDRILPGETFVNRNFIDVMRPYITNKMLSTSSEYIELLFSEHIEESLIQDLNPLQEVSVHIDSKDGSFSVRHLQFSFRRTWNSQQLSHVLVSVSDITESTLLREALKKSEQKSEDDMAMLTAILHLDPQVLDDFLIASNETLEQINRVFRQTGRNHQALAEKLVKTQRLAHKLKGDCSLIDLRFLVERVHHFENRLKTLHEKPTLSGDDFVGPAVDLDRLMRDVSNVQALTTRLSQFSKTGTFNTEKGTSHSTRDINWHQQLQKMADSIARDEGKAVQILWNGHATEQMPSSLRAAIQDVIVQCTRNAVCHGIETPDMRMALGKIESGTISIALQQNKNTITLKIHDDGSGINLKEIRAKALENRIMSAEALEKLDTAKLLTMIFHPNFSTARNSSLHAGRGVGLSLVREILRNNKASVSLKHRAGQHTEFSFSFPTEYLQQKIA